MNDKNSDSAKARPAGPGQPPAPQNKPAEQSRPPAHADKSDDTVKQLVLMAMTGDKDAFRNLYQKYYRLMTAMVFQKIGDANDVEDIVQEVFLKAWCCLPKLRTPSRFLPWLLKIAQHHCTDHIRRASRKPKLPRITRDPAASHVQPGDRLNTQETFQAIFQGLQKLPEKYRLILTMRYLDGLTPADIAQRLREPSGTIRNRIFRALHKLEKIMTEQTSPDGRGGR